MAKLREDIKNKIKRNVTRIRVSERGGGVEIELTEYGYPNQLMSAYQNYLGGGIAGAIANDCTIEGWRENKQLVRLSENLKKYYFLQVHGELEGYEFNQSLSVSAY